MQDFAMTPTGIIDGAPALLAQMPDFSDAKLPLWVFGSIWAANQLGKTWLDIRQRRIDQDKAGCLGELAECKEREERKDARIIALEKENAALYVTVGQKDRQIEHHLTEKKMLLEAQQETVKQVVDQGREIAQLTIELQHVGETLRRVDLLEQKVEAQAQSGPTAVVIDPASEPVPVKVVE
jgi:hypothetical protein